jgi:hypothetical protein
MKITDTPIVYVTPTWPNFLVRAKTITPIPVETGFRKVQIDTIVRIVHKGQWYLTKASEKYQFDTVDPQAMENAEGYLAFALQRLCTNIYLLQHNRVEIDIDLKDPNGEPMYKLDRDQRTEEERLHADYLKNL